MKYQMDKEIVVDEKKASYIISSQHRNAEPKIKTKWIISLLKEVNCFKTSYRYNWCNNYVGWGIVLEDGELLVVGRNRFNETLKIAKFIDSNRNTLWHGYPTDYVRNVQDRPNINVLLEWKKRGFIQKHQAKKIRAGIKCSL